MAIKQHWSNKPRNILRWTLLSAGAISIIGLLIFLLWPLITYDWSAGAERIYTLKGATTGYDYVVTQEPANAIQGKEVRFRVEVRNKGVAVTDLTVVTDVSRPCVYGWQRCDSSVNSYSLSNNGFATSVVQPPNSGSYWFEVFIKSKDIVDGGGSAEGGVNFRVYPSWLGWIIKQ